MPIIPATWETEIRKIAVQGQPTQKVSETLSQRTIWIWCVMSVIPATWRRKVGGWRSQAGPGKKSHPITKTNLK
jgi:hypothetical protein